MSADHLFGASTDDHVDDEQDDHVDDRDVADVDVADVDDELDQDRPRKSVATQLVELASEVYNVSLADDGTVFAVPKSGPRIVYPLRGGRSSLRSALARLYFTRTGRAASQQALADALMILDGQGQQSDPQPLHLRVAEAEGAWWIDLGDQTGRTVKVTATGWELAQTAPVLFRRTALTGPLPEPIFGSDLGGLWELLNVQVEDRPLVLAWLVAVLIPGIAHPILGLFGEQGAGKTTAGRILGGLLDPSPVPVRKAPRDAESWVTAASGSWVVALDNLSAMPDWLSDSLSRAITGEGDVRRQLYSDADLVVYSFRRAVIVTSIDLGAAKGDFGDRLLPINLDPISETQRLTDRALWPRWERTHPRVLGALLDVAASVARVLPTVALSTHTRMADFMEVLAAVDQVTGSAGLERYRVKVYSLAAETLTADAFVSAVRKSLPTDEPWEGTSAELLTLVTPTEERWREPKGCRARRGKSPPSFAGRRPSCVRPVGPQTTSARTTPPTWCGGGWQYQGSRAAINPRKTRDTRNPPVRRVRRVRRVTITHPLPPTPRSAAARNPH